MTNTIQTSNHIESICIAINKIDHSFKIGFKTIKRTKNYLHRDEKGNWETVSINEKTASLTKIFKKLEKDLEKDIFDLAQKKQSINAEQISNLKTGVGKLKENYYLAAGVFAKFSSKFKQTEKQYQHLMKFLDKIEELNRVEIEQNAQNVPDGEVSKAFEKAFEDHNAIEAFNACKGGNLKQLERLLKDHPEYRSSAGPNLLHVASYYGQHEIMSYLLKTRGVKLNIHTPDLSNDKTALHYACMGGKVSAVALLLAHGAHIDAKDKDHQTPLLSAASGETYQKEVISYLISQGAHVNIQTKSSRQSALHAIAEKGDKDNTEALLKIKGAKVDLKNSQGRTALHLAAGKNHIETVEVLLNHRASVKAKDAQKNTPLHSVFVNDVKDNSKIVDLLLSKGTNVNAKNKKGDTPLHLLLKTTNSIPEKRSTLEKLLNKGAQINARNKFGETPLHKAVETGSSEIVIFLIKNGADLFIKSNQGSTPLTLACYKGDLSLVKDIVQTMFAKKGTAGFRERKIIKSIQESLNLTNKSNLDIKNKNEIFKYFETVLQSR